MKKLVTLFTLAIAMVASADVASQNIVGYTTVTAKANDMTMLGIPFEAVGGASGIPIQSIKGNFNGGDGLSSADNLYVWTSTGYKFYYYGYWGDPENPDWDNKWYDNTDTETADVLLPGQALWYVRKGTAFDITLAGQVKAGSTEIPVKANDMTMFSCPYPVATPIQNLGIVSPVGGDGLSSADNLYVWTSTGYKFYYYGYWGDPENPSWDNKWYDSTDTETADALELGQAAWYVRKGAATTISFSSPL